MRKAKAFRPGSPGTKSLIDEHYGINACKGAQALFWI